jgi:hypothetical protein
MSLESITNEEWEAATQGFNTSEDRATTANLMSQGISAAEARAQAAQAQAKADAVRNLITGGAGKDILYGSVGGAKPDTMSRSFYEVVKDLFGGKYTPQIDSPVSVFGTQTNVPVSMAIPKAEVPAMPPAKNVGVDPSKYGPGYYPDLELPTGLQKEGETANPLDAMEIADDIDPVMQGLIDEAYNKLGAKPGYDLDALAKAQGSPTNLGLGTVPDWLAGSTKEILNQIAQGPVTGGVNPSDSTMFGNFGKSFNPGLALISFPGAVAKAISDTQARTRSGRSAEQVSNLVSDIPGQMPSTTPTLTPTEPPPMYEDNESGNIAAIRRFLQDPNYGNIPQVDPMSSLTALQNAIGGIDALVGERGFTGQGYAQAARDRAQGIFDKFLPGQDVDALLNEKIGRAFAEEALTAKGSEFRQQGVQSIEQSFPEGFASDIFSPEAFSKAAENIYGQKLQGAQDVIARAGARGQLSPRGGRLASESLLSQGPDVRGGISDIVSGVRSGLEGGLQGIRGSALEQAQGYQLGDELFDVTPFEQQASDYVTGAFGDIPSDISGAIGTDPLFDAVSALQTGGRQQGQVSGTPSFLDVLAEREGGVGTGRDRRGLGSRGSGVF